MTLNPYKKKTPLNLYKAQRPFVEIDQFKFETLLREHSLPSDSIAKLSFGVCITNQSLVAQRFVLFYLKPVFFRLNRDRNKWKSIPYLGANYNGTWFPQSDDCCVLEPGESIDFWQEGEFWLSEGKWCFSIKMKDGGCPFWESFNPGGYGLKCEYHCPVLGKAAKIRPCQEFDYDDAWVGKIITPLIEFKLYSRSQAPLGNAD
jgi:hypothetical protein